MKTDTPQSIEKKQNSSNGYSNAKKQKSYYDRFLELMMRKTDSESRAQEFGFDPFK